VGSCVLLFERGNFPKDVTVSHTTNQAFVSMVQIWSLDVDPSEQRLVTGSADIELRWYAVAVEAGASGREPSGGSSWDLLTPLGSIRRQSTERVATLRFNPSGTLLGCQGPGKALELYR
jgi:U3 small nucleolar RNA-associated protein 12